MQPWYYFSRPHQMAFHDLTLTKLPPNLKSLLGLSLKFCPTPRYTTSNINATLTRFERDLTVKSWLFGEPEDPDREPYDPSIYVRSNWTPKPWEVTTEVTSRLCKFDAALRLLFKKRRSPSNLLPHQRRSLSMLMRSDTHVVAQSDKGLGPAVLERPRYISRAFTDHLDNRNHYLPIPTTNIKTYQNSIEGKIKKWIADNRSSCTPMELRFLRKKPSARDKPFPIFYLTIKRHKDPWKTRPSYPAVGPSSTPWEYGSTATCKKLLSSSPHSSKIWRTSPYCSAT